MSVPDGYKQTEAGIIPDKWKAVPLLSVVQIASGQVDPKMEPYKSMTLVAPDHIEGGTGKLLSRRSAGDQKAISGKYLFGPGTVIYSKIRPYLVKATAVEFEGLCSADMYPLIPGEGVDASYLLAVLLGDHFTSYAISVSARSGMPKINRAELAGYYLALPPLSEQTAIGLALSDADALIASLEALAEKKRRIKDGTMHALLTGATRLPGFEGEWEARRLGNLGATYGGLTGKSKRHFGHGDGRYVPFMNVITNVVVDSNQLDRVEIAPSESQNSVLRGNILLNGSSETPEEVAFAAAVEDDFEGVYLNSFCFGYRLKSGAEATPLFLAYFLRATPGRSLVAALAQGATRYNISKRAFLKLEALLPTYQEQQAIVTVLSGMDAELQALNDQIEKARRVKAGMMQDLLTGSVRLL